jgi:hypothetical protein
MFGGSVEQQVFIQPFEVEDRLKHLGLTEQLLLDPVRRGFFAWLNCTQNHPPAFPGIMAWGEANCGLREGLLPLGWERYNDRNLPLTINRDTGVALTVSSGDECTGIEGMVPRTRNPKGVTMKEATSSNRAQLGLFSDMDAPPDPTDLEAIEEWSTWLLLTYRDSVSRTVRCELSRPIAIGIDGRVDGWAERIILGSIPFDGDEVSLARDNDKGGNGSGSAENGDDGTIQVEVRRRA